MDIDNVEFAKKYVAEDMRQRLLNTAMAQNSRKECTFNTKFAMGGGGVENQLLSLCIQIDQFLALCWDFQKEEGEGTHFNFLVQIHVFKIVSFYTHLIRFHLHEAHPFWFSLGQA
jgi:hypothetical protein